MSEPAAVRAYSASDYAGLTSGDWAFYYGYEYGQLDGMQRDEETWGFQVKRGQTVLMRESYEAMRKYKGCPDQFEPQDCLVFGIGLFVATW